MTEHDNSHEIDAEVGRLFDSIKQIQPPIDAQLEFRKAVAAELARSRSNSPTLAWWQRSISIPVPVAMALTVLVMAGLWFQATLSKSEMANRIDTPFPSEDHTKDPRIDAQTLAIKLPTSKRHQSNVYLCGVGSLSSETRYIIEDL